MVLYCLLQYMKDNKENVKAWSYLMLGQTGIK